MECEFVVQNDSFRCSHDTALGCNFQISSSPDFNTEDLKAKSEIFLKGNISCRIFFKKGILVMAASKKIMFEFIGENMRYLNQYYLYQQKQKYKNDIIDVDLTFFSCIYLAVVYYFRRLLGNLSKHL